MLQTTPNPLLSRRRQPGPGEAQPPRRIGLDRDPRLERRAAKRRLVRLVREQAAAEQIARLPEPLEDIVIVLTGRYHGFDILGAILQLAGEAVHCEEAWIATLGFNKSQTDALAEMIDAGRIGRMTFIVSDMFKEMNHAEFTYLQTSLRQRGSRCEVTRNHAKLMLLRLSDGRHIVTHGSLNLRRCSSFEQVVITQDRELFTFFAEFLDDTISGRVQA